MKQKRPDGKIAKGNGHFDKVVSVEVEARRAQVASLYRARLTYRKIASQLGISPATVCRDVEALVEEWQKESLDNITKQRALANATINEALTTLIHKVRSDSTGTPAREGKPAVEPNVDSITLGAVGQIKGLLERQAKLLGLDQPTQIDVRDKTFTITKPAPREFDKSVLEDNSDNEAD